MADLIITESGAVHRPRNVDWKRAAALLYGDWGTSKAYVIGLAFLAAGFSSLPIILAVCALTGLVGINYIVICRHFPDGGGVYSAARSQGRLLAVIGALLLLADLTVTAALSGWSALTYITSGAEHIAWIKFLRDHIALTTIAVLLIMGLINYFGPKHSGTLAVALAIPTVIVVVILIAISVPHLTRHFLQPRHESLTTVWVQFVGVILALSGAESIANITAIVAIIGLLYMMSRDREMPRQFRRLNRHGVPIYPLIIALGLPAVVLLFVANFTALAGLYAIGVVGAITVNVGSCTFNRSVGFTWYDRVLFGVTFCVLFVVEVTLAHTKQDALFFVVVVLGAGLALRAYTQKRQGLTTLTVTREVAEMVGPDLEARVQPRLQEGQKIMVAARGITPVLGFALDEAQLRKATLCVLFVKEVAVYFSGGPASLGRAKWQDDPEANAIMSLMMKLGSERDVCVIPVYAVSQDASATIVDLSATMGVDYLVIGATQRTALANLLRGSVVTNVAQHLPESIQLLIFG